MLTIDIITIFPAMFSPILGESIVKRAQEKKKVRIRVHDLRNFSRDKHKKVDDRPFGGGPGMVMTPQPIFSAVQKIKGRREACVVLAAANARPFTQKVAKKLSKIKNLIFICGHYEGVDERVREALVQESLSIGDYVLTGGELPVMVMVDAVVRLVPGVLGKEASLQAESYEGNLLEYPHYTRPARFMGKAVPQVLLSGHHKEIETWRDQQSLLMTRKYRPDLLKNSK